MRVVRRLDPARLRPGPLRGRPPGHDERAGVVARRVPGRTPLACPGLHVSSGTAVRRARLESADGVRLYLCGASRGEGYIEPSPRCFYREFLPGAIRVQPITRCRRPEE